MSVGQASAEVPVRADKAAANGNAQARTATLIASPLIGVDSVSNVAPILGGIDAESDDALRDRFRSYINSRSRATTDARAFAISTIQQGLSFVIQENTDAAGGSRMGHFLVVLDDGSGSPPDDLVSAVVAAIDRVRPVGSVFAVRKPQILTVDVSMNLDMLSEVSLADVRPQVTSAVETYINQLAIGATLSVTRLAQAAYAAASAVNNVSAISVNGQNNDLVPDGRTVFKAGLVSVI
jgi:uncharacterized phage protein gp47/JayE